MDRPQKESKRSSSCLIIIIIILSILLLLAIAAIFVLAFYTKEDDSSENEHASSFYTKNISLFLGSATKSFQVRFYSDAPSVPYCGFKQFYNQFHQDPVDLFYNGSVYIAKQPNGGIVIIDVVDSMLTISDISLLFLDEYDISGSEPVLQTQRQIFAKSSHDDITTINPGTINLAKYHIRLYSDGDEVYFPIPTLADMYIGVEGQFVAYNEKDLYYFNQYDSVDNYYNNTYWEVALSDSPRPSDFVEYTYNELCLVFDSFRGLTTQLALGDNNILGIGLNGALEKYCPELKTILHSQNRREYTVGFYSLLHALDDGAHTRIVVQDPTIAEQDEILQHYPTIPPFIQPPIDRRAERDRLDAEVGAVRVDKLSLTQEEQDMGLYYRSNTTASVAMIGFTLFNLEDDAWDEYYNHNGTLPENDTFPFIVNGMKRAKEEGIKRVVLDLSVNGGGAADTLVSILGLLTGKDGYLEYHNVFNKANLKRWSAIDKTFDGTYNSSSLVFDFDFAVMSGPFSYSCGNALPVYAKDNGILIIGQNSAGGSSIVAMTAAPGGLLYRYSSPFSLCTSTGANVDPGVEVDYKLYDLDDDGAIDYEHFYDMDRITAAFDGFYNH